MQVEERLEDLGVDLETPGEDTGKFAPAVRSGNLVFTSAYSSDETGKLGADVPATQGYHEVREAAARCLGAVRSVIGDLDKVSRIVKIQVFLNCTAEFTDQVQVLHGATELIVDAFGEQVGRHARSSAGVLQLHDNATVAVDMIVEVTD